MGIASRIRSARKVLRQARYVQGKYGVPVRQQLRDIWRLRRNTVGPSDYYMYALFDPKRFPDFATKQTYGGWRLFEGEFRHYSAPNLQAMAYHKHILYRLLGSFGIPVPEIHALYSPLADGFERNRALRTREELAEFLRTTDAFPIFGKPSQASEGFGGRGILHRNGDGTLRLVTGDDVTVADMVEDIHAIAAKTGTYMLLEFLQNNDQVRELAGETAASTRVVVLMRDGEPELFKATMLIPAAGSHVSNARGMETGACSALVDLETGRLHRILSAIGPDIEWITEHPATGVRLDGVELEAWPQVEAMALEAARSLSPFHMQHWDIAQTRRGPVVMEMNFIGSVIPLQIHGPPGIFTEQFRSFAATQKVW